MREIKFRAKGMEDDKWHCGQLVLDKYLNEYFIMEEFYLDNSFIKVSPETICQFTGKRDKNGNEIYEFDIVRGDFPYAEYGIVIWDENRCGFYILPVNVLFKIASDKYYKMNANKLEVFGNIFDDSDLIFDEMIKETKDEQAKELLNDLKEKGVKIDVKLLIDFIKKPPKSKTLEVKLTRLIPYCYKERIRSEK